MVHLKKQLIRVKLLNWTTRVKLYAFESVKTTDSLEPFVHESDYTNHAVFYSVKELDHRSHLFQKPG